MRPSGDPSCPEVCVPLAPADLDWSRAERDASRSTFKTRTALMATLTALARRLTPHSSGVSLRFYLCHVPGDTLPVVLLAHEDFGVHVVTHRLASRFK